MPPAAIYPSHGPWPPPNPPYLQMWGGWEAAHAQLGWTQHPQHHHHPCLPPTTTCRSGEVEKQYRLNMGSLPIGYRSEPEGGRFIYILDDALTTYSAGGGCQGGC